MSRLVAIAVTVVLAAPSAALAQKSAGSAAKADDSEAATAAGVYVQDLLEASPPTGAAITSLDVDNRLGDIRIVGHDGRGLSIFAVKHASDAETLERLEVILVQDPSGPVSIRTQLSTGGSTIAIPAGSARIDLVVRVPRSARVSAAVWNGKLRAKGLDNGAVVAANEGSIHVEEVSGTVSAESAAGDQRFEKIYGDLDARALEGDVDVDTLRGEILAASVKTGSVSARSVVVREMVIRVIKGDIRVEAEIVAGGSYTITSISGDVEASLTGKTKAELRVATRKGEMTLPERFRPRESSASEIVGYLGSGTSPAHVDVRTRTGNVVVKQF